MKLDILAFGAHPDDIEIFMGGAAAAFKAQGHRIGVCDLTRGEAGTYGNADIRQQELETAARIMGLDARVTLDIPDGSVRNTEENRLKVIRIIRKYRPELVFTFSRHPMRHPDHTHTGDIVRECCFLAGLEKIETGQEPFRPSGYAMYPELLFNGKPDFVVDISDFWEAKVNAIRAYGSQVTAEQENDGNAKTFIRSNRFWEVLKARAITAGDWIGTKYGEPFFSDLPIRADDVLGAFLKPGHH